MSLVRDVTTVSGATLLSRLLGFLRDVAIAAVLGAGALADAFFVALQIPNLFRRLLAEGAINSAFVPLWLRCRQDGGDQSAHRFGAEVLATLGIALAAAAALCAVSAPVMIAVLAPGFANEPSVLGAQFLRLAAPYLAIVGLVAVLSAILNAAGRVGAAAYSPAIFNLVMIATAVAIMLGGLAMVPAAGAILAGAIVVAGLFQLLLVGGATLRLPGAPLLARPSLSSDVRCFFRMLLPGVIAAGLPQLTLIAGTIVASSSPAAVSWLTYGHRLYELPLGLISVGVASVMTPAIAAHIRADDRAASAAVQSRAFELALGLALPAALGLALLAEPIVAGLFERGAFGARDTAAVAGVVAALAFGIPGHALEKVLASVSFAHEDTRTPMLTALAGLATAVVAALILYPRHGHVGIALAMAACGFVSAALLGIALYRTRRLATDAAFRQRLLRMVLATALMGIAILGSRWLMATPRAASTSSIQLLLTMMAHVSIGLLVYVAALRLLGVVTFTARPDARKP